MNIHVYIERIVLDGPLPHLPELESGVQTALMRALGSSPLPIGQHPGARSSGAEPAPAHVNHDGPLAERIGNAVHAAMSAEPLSIEAGARMQGRIDGYSQCLPGSARARS